MPRPAALVLLFALTMGLGGCDLVGDLIELGFWMAVIGIVFVIAILGWIWKKMRGPRRP